jgi:hypothetical protein
MKVLLRHRRTAEYLATESWVINPAEAHDFAKPEFAIQYSRQSKLPQLELVMRYDNPVSEIVLPLD